MSSESAIKGSEAEKMLSGHYGGGNNNNNGDDDDDDDDDYEDRDDAGRYSFGGGRPRGIHVRWR